jgi:hypothetical protein
LKLGIETLMRVRGGISGASSSAPPASPERWDYGILPDPHRIVWTQDALKDMQAREISASDIMVGLLRGAMVKRLQPQRLAGAEAVYSIRLPDNYRALFTVKNEQVIILGIARHRH